MTVKATNVKAEDPAASPSRPSVRLTAFGEAHEDQHRHQDPPDAAQLPTQRIETGEREMGVDLQPDDGNQGEGQRHSQLADDLRPFVEAQAALAGNFQPVVDKPHQGGGADREHAGQAPGGERGEDVGHDPPHDRRRHYGEPTHGGRARLGEVPGRAVFTDLLADPPGAQVTYQERGTEHGHQQGDSSCQQQGLHRALSWPTPGRQRDKARRATSTSSKGST